MTGHAEKKARQVDDEPVHVSFEFLDFQTEHFFVCGMDAPYYEKFFACLEEIRNAPRKSFAAQTHPSLCVKPIFNGDTSLYDAFPDRVVEKIADKLYVETRDRAASKDQAKDIAGQAFEVRVAKGLGRIHGFLWNATYNLVWIDPGHNLYCKGKPKGYEDIATVRAFSPEQTRELQDRLRELQGQYDELLTAWAAS